MLDQKKLQEKFYYSPATGLFHYRVSPNNQLEPGDIAGGVDKNYWYICIDGRYYRRARLVWLYVHGRWPTQVDHINLNKLDDRIGNLREVTQAQNCKNKPKGVRNKSGYKGVHQDKGGRRWVAQIAYRIPGGKKTIHLGTFDTPQEASLAYQTAACHIYGPYARF